MYKRNSLLDQISKINKKIFIPLIVGGGVRSVDDIKKILKAGADKIIINTAAVKDPKFITEAARIFGSSTIVVAIEVTKDRNGNYFVFTDNGREKTDKDALNWALEAESRHAGEIIITSIDREGTGEGLDFEFTEKISKKTKIPIVAHGGASEIDDIINIFKKTEVSGISISSMLHYNIVANRDEKFIKNHNLNGNLTFLNSKKKFKNFGAYDLLQIKNKMKKSKLFSREI